MSNCKGFHSFKTGGIEVYLRVKPYPSQMSMMCRVVETIQKEENALIESPTGTGKTVALLSASMAWLVEEKRRAEEEEEKQKNQKVQLQQPLFEWENDSDDDDDFEETQGSLKRRMSARIAKVKRQKDSQVAKKNVSVENTSPSHSEHCQSDTLTKDSGSSDTADQGNGRKKKRIPKLYYGSRTHRQIQQVVSELGKTPYTNVKHAVLASRENTCINKGIMTSKNKSEACQELLGPQGNGCKYHSNLQKLCAGNLRNSLTVSLEEERDNNEIWDIEDLVNLGKKEEFCPYFASTRLLKSTAELIFCPYNYLIDPKIRHCMEIGLNEDIVILDEAHNIEEACSEAASLTMSEEELTRTITNLNFMGSDKALGSYRGRNEDKQHLEASIAQLKNRCESFNNCVNTMADGERMSTDEIESEVYCGEQLAEMVSEVGWNSLDTVDEDFEKLSVIVRPEGECQNSKSAHGVKKFPLPQLSTEKTLRNLLHFMKLFLKDSSIAKDYKMVIDRKIQQREATCTDASPDSTNGTEIPKSTKTTRIGVSSLAMSGYTIHFWCLNPAVTFRDAFDRTRSVILASGTLCPTESLMSELGLSFTVKLEAAHPVKQAQVFASTLSTGPTGNSMRCTYNSYNEGSLLDEIGNSVSEICKIVPGGVLVFVPSYYVQNNLRERWEETGLLRNLNETKVVIWEPKTGSNMNEIMESFYTATKTSEPLIENTTGALLVAVLRGKVSEGVDFSDESARAVITIGIPYPALKDLRVNLKRQYNDTFNKTSKLLTGKQWYETQAFRALNQALGRCVRHTKDWGALIMLDQRFSESPEQYCRGISNWIKKQLNHYQSFESFTQDLSEFVAGRLKYDVPDSA